MNTLIEEKTKKILNGGCATTQAIGILQSGEKRKLRIFKSMQGNYCYKLPRKKNYGYPLDDLQLKDLLVYNTFKRKTEAQIWYGSWLKVEQRLEESKLFPDMLNDVKIALDVGYEKLNKAYTQYWIDNKEISDKEKYEKNNRLNAEKIKAIDPRLVESSKENLLFVNTSIIWYMHKPARVKKMRFQRGVYNEEILKEIAIALKKKEKCYKSGRLNYDISFEYNPKVQKAWYSEEYKNCGNGHYYLALDATHALFYEDD